MNEQAGMMAVNVDLLGALPVGPGCWRRDLPSRDGVRLWIVDMEANSEWPCTDMHDEFGEDVFVVAGSVIEGDQEYQAGTYLHFAPNSSHRPRSADGATLFGMNLTPRT